MRNFILPELRLTVIVWALSAGRDTRSSVLLKGNILEALGRNEDARAWKSRADSMPQRNWSESLTLRLGYFLRRLIFAGVVFP